MNGQRMATAIARQSRSLNKQVNAPRQDIGALDALASACEPFPLCTGVNADDDELALAVGANWLGSIVLY